MAGAPRAGRAEEGRPLPHERGKRMPPEAANPQQAVEEAFVELFREAEDLASVPEHRLRPVLAALEETTNVIRSIRPPRALSEPAPSLSAGDGAVEGTPSPSGPPSAAGEGAVSGI